MTACSRWLCTPCISQSDALGDIVVVERVGEKAVRGLVVEGTSKFRRGSPRLHRHMVLQPFSFKLTIGEENRALPSQFDEREPKVLNEGCLSARSTSLPSESQGFENLELRLRLAVWDGDLDAVQAMLQEWPNLLAATPRRGRNSRERFNSQAALALAIRLQRLEIVCCLLDAGADILATDGDGWRLEAHVPRAFPDVDSLLSQAAMAAGMQRLADWKERAFVLADRLQDFPDCDLLLHWTFSTWLPVVGRLLPQDTVHVRKLGSRIRIDYTLKSVSGLNWEHGNCTMLACIDEDADVYFLDHDQRKVHTLENKLLRSHCTEQDRAKKQRRRTLKRGCLDTSKVRFQDTKQLATCGAFENCKVYQLDGLEYTTLVLPRLQGSQGTRVEEGKATASRWRNLMKFAKGLQGQRNSCSVSYASPDVLEFQATFPDCELANHRPTVEALPPPAVGQVRQISGNVLMSSDFPLSREQFVTIAEALSASDERYLSIKDFFQMSLPDGFPVKFTIPVVPALSATLSFNEAHIRAQDPEQFEVPDGFEEAVAILPSMSFRTSRSTTRPSFRSADSRAPRLTNNHE